MFAAGVDRSLHTLDPIALARAFSEGGRGYISRARARDREIPVTADTIATAVWGLAFIRDPAVRRELDDGAAEARRIRAEQPELIDAVLASAETIDAARDYGMNCAPCSPGSTCPRSRWVSPPHWWRSTPGSSSCEPNAPPSSPVSSSRPVPRSLTSAPP